MPEVSLSPLCGGYGQGPAQPRGTVTWLEQQAQHLLLPETDQKANEMNEEMNDAPF